MARIKTVRNKLLIYIFLAFTIPYILSGILISKIIMEKAQQDYAISSYQYMDKVHLKISDGIIEPAYEALAMMALNDNNIKLVDEIGDRIISEPAQISIDRIENLKQFHKIYKYNKGIAIGTKWGGYLSYPDFYGDKIYNPTSRGWYQEALKNKGKPVIIDPYMRTTKELSMAVVHTIDRGNDTIGVIACGFDLQDLQNKVGGINIGDSGYIMVLNQNNKFVVSPKHSEWLLKTPKEVGIANLTNFQDTKGQIHEINLDGKKHFMCINVSDKTGWKIISLIDSSVLTEKVQQIVYPIIIIYCITLAFILLVVFVVSEQITDPIKILTRGALAISVGDLDERVDIKRKDEFGILATAFNDMVTKLRNMFNKIQKQNEELYKREQEFKSLVENAKDVVIRLDINLRYLYINPIIECYTGIDVNELIGKIVGEEGFSDVFLQAINETLIDPLEPDRDHLVEFEFSALSGEILYFQAKIIPEINKEGIVETILVVVRNITEQKQLEKQLIRLDRLNIIGEMAAGIAHEVRNPMTTVRGFLQMFANKEEQSKYHKHFMLMIDELDRANGIISEFLSFSKNKAVDLQTNSLNEIVQKLQPLIQADAFVSNKDVIVELGEIPLIRFDGKEIRQLILNIARNGLEAMSEYGCLRIKTYSNGEQVVLAIQDEGPGIDPNVMDKIGIPFMTTKENGTGLGLAICYSIAVRHNAEINIETGPKGTTFFICFRLKNLEIQEM